MCKAGVVPYTNITGDEAKIQAEAMYNSNNNVEGELMSSYAWDTALNFICQTNVENEEGYNLAFTRSISHANIDTKSRQNTGENVADNYSNIHDLIGNCREFNTEFCSRYDAPYVARGAYYSASSYAANRSFEGSPRDYASFRLQVYIK